MNSFHIGSKKSGVSKLKRSTDRGGVKDAEACEAPPSASAAGLLTLKLNDAHHLSDPKQPIYCQFTLGMQRVYSRFGGRRATTPPAEGTPPAASLLATSPSATVASPSTLPLRNPYSAAMSPSSATGVSSPRHATSLPPNAHTIPVKKRGEVELVWDEVFNFLVEHKVKDLHVTVFLCHPVEGDKVIGTHTVKLSDCTEYETNTFCVKLAKPEGGLVWFQVKYYSLFTPTEAKEYEEYLSMISEQTFLDLFKKDRYGFALAESDMQDYKNHLRNRAKHPPTRIFTRKQWQQVKTIKEYKPLTRKGMPSCHRAEVWLCTSRAKQRKRHNKGMYWTLLEVHANESSVHTTQIVKDLSRTFPGHKVFASKKGREPLKRVLTAYAWKNSSIGYCQSMNFVAGFLLLFMDEESAFWLLTNLVEEIVPDYYSPAMIGAKADQIVFKQLLQKKLPQLHAHFEALSVPYHQVIIQWLLSLYVEFLPTETVLRVFDALLYEGSVVLLRIGLAIFKLKERALLATRDFEECWNLLKVLPRSIHDADALFKVLSTAAAAAAAAAAYGDFGSLKELKISARRRNAYREIEEQESLSNFISLRQPFRFLDGKSLIRLVARLTELRPTLIAASVTASFSSSPVPIAISPPATAPLSSAAAVASGDLTPRGESAAAASLANNSFRVDFDTFLRVLLEIDHLLDEHHIRTLFKAFDQDTRGTVDFFELICGLSVVFNGAPLQKLMACFHAYDEDKDNRLTIKEMQLFVETHYKWLLRLLNKDKGDGTPWHVQPTVQHDTEGLWKKLRPYVEEKGGMLGFVEFRFKVANELEALQQWLETETMMPGPRTARPGRSAAAIHQSATAKADDSSGDAKAGGAHDEDEESTTTDSDDDSGDDDLRHSAPPPAQPDVSLTGGEDEELRSLPRGQRSEEFPAFATSPPMSPQFLRRNQSASVASISSSSYTPSGGGGGGGGKAHRGNGTSAGNGGGAGGKKKGHDGERRGSLEPRLSAADESNTPSSPRHHHHHHHQYHHAVVGSPPAGSVPHRLEHAVSAGGESQWLLESLKALGLEGEGSEIVGGGGGRMSGMPVMSSMPSLASAVRQPPPIPDRGLNRTTTHPRPIGE